MNSKNKIEIPKEVVQKAIDETPTMGAAAKKLGIEWRTFKIIASEYGIYKPVILNRWHAKYELIDILLFIAISN